MAPDESKGKGPTQGRAARTAMLGRVAAGGAVRWAATGSTRAAPRRSASAGAATGSWRRSTRWSTSSRSMRGAAMKAGQVLSTVEFPGLDPDQSEYLQQRLASLRDNVPAVSWKQMREVLEREWGEPPEQRARRDRPRAGRRREHRPGPPRRASRTGGSSRSRSSTPGSPRPSSPTCATCGCSPGLAPADAGPRHQGPARRARPADDRGVRLRARGGQPPPHRALLARPPVHLGPARSTPRSAAGGCW